MEDVTNLAFRRICKRVANPGLMFTEFVSAMAFHYNADRTVPKMRVDPEERPLGVQIFGGEPEVMAQIAKQAEREGADLVDINMGCWVPKVCRTGSGAALLKDPDLAADIVAAVAEAVSIPTTVKVRAGWDYSLFAAPQLAERFQNAGAKMLTLHARFAKQGFEGQADWALIKELRAAIDIPLIGNGDVKTADDALRMMEETGCDGVMVGRAAIGNPWALARIVAGVKGEPEPAAPTLRDRIQVAIEHARAMVAADVGFADYSEVEQLAPERRAEVELRGIRQLRGQLPLYVKGERGASKVRAELSRVESVADLTSILENYALQVEEEVRETEGSLA
jgi:nifR3 family TIM-barrel protein